MPAQQSPPTASVSLETIPAADATPTELWDRLHRFIVEQFDGSVLRFCRYTGLSRRVVDEWARGVRAPTEHELRRCARAGCELVWLADGTGPMIRQRSAGA